MFRRTLSILSLSSLCLMTQTLAEQGPAQAQGAGQPQGQMLKRAPAVRQQAQIDSKSKVTPTIKQANCPAKLTVEQVRTLSEPEKNSRGYSKEGALKPLETGTYRLRLVSPIREPGPLSTLKSKLDAMKGGNSGSWDLKNDEILGGAAGAEQFLCTYENPQVKDPKSIKVSSHVKKK